MAMPMMNAAATDMVSWSNVCVNLALFGGLTVMENLLVGT